MGAAFCPGSFLVGLIQQRQGKWGNPGPQKSRARRCQPSAASARASIGFTFGVRGAEEKERMRARARALTRHSFSAALPQSLPCWHLGRGRYRRRMNGRSLLFHSTEGWAGRLSERKGIPFPSPPTPSHTFYGWTGECVVRRCALPDLIHWLGDLLSLNSLEREVQLCEKRAHLY